MTTLENIYFGNIIPSEYRQKKDTKKKLSEMIELLDELKSLLTDEQQKKDRTDRQLSAVADRVVGT